MCGLGSAKCSVWVYDEHLSMDASHEAGYIQQMRTAHCASIIHTRTTYTHVAQQLVCPPAYTNAPAATLPPPSLQPAAPGSAATSALMCLPYQSAAPPSPRPATPASQAEMRSSASPNVPTCRCLARECFAQRGSGVRHDIRGLDCLGALPVGDQHFSASVYLSTSALLVRVYVLLGTLDTHIFP